MDQTEFDNTSWGAGMICLYNLKERDITSVDFTEHLIGLVNKDDDEMVDWVRCENVELLKANKFEGVA
jgi:hypothetical protein